LFPCPQLVLIWFQSTKEKSKQVGLYIAYPGKNCVSCDLN